MSSLFSTGGLASLGKISTDFFILIVIFLLVAMYGAFKGKSKIVSLIISMYVASLLYVSNVFIDKLTFFRSTPLYTNLSRILVFLVILLVVHFLLNKVIHSTFSYSKTKRVAEIAILSFLTTALLVSITYFVVSINSLHVFGASIKSFFGASQTVFFFWLVMPIITLIVTTRD